MKARTKQTSDNARRDEPKQRNKQNKRGSLEGHEVGRLRLAVAGSGVDGQRQIKEPIAEGVGAADAQLVLVAFERVDQQNSVARRRRRRARHVHVELHVQPPTHAETVVGQVACRTVRSINFVIYKRSLGLASS